MRHWKANIGQRSELPISSSSSPPSPLLPSSSSSSSSSTLLLLLPPPPPPLLVGAAAALYGRWCRALSIPLPLPPQGCCQCGKATCPGHLNTFHSVPYSAAAAAAATTVQLNNKCIEFGDSVKLIAAAGFIPSSSASQYSRRAYSNDCQGFDIG